MLNILSSFFFLAHVTNQIIFQALLKKRLIYYDTQPQIKDSSVSFIGLLVTQTKWPRYRIGLRDPER